MPDGVFNFIENTIEILSAPERTIDELTRLANILREAQETHQAPEEVAASIQNELPALARLGALLPKNRAELYGFLAVVLAAAQLIQSSLSSQQPPITVNVTQVINQAAAQPSLVPSQPSSARLQRKVGRNEQCPCGSGKKYKKCCGASR